MRFIHLCVLMVCAALLVTPAIAEHSIVSSAEVSQMAAAGTPVIDIRRPAEWSATGVIEGSHLMTFFDQNGHYDIEVWLSKLNKVVEKDQPFILVSTNGNRASQLARYLDREFEFGAVYHLEDGLNSWLRHGNMVVH